MFKKHSLLLSFLSICSILCCGCSNKTPTNSSSESSTISYNNDVYWAGNLPSQFWFEERHYKDCVFYDSEYVINNFSLKERVGFLVNKNISEKYIEDYPDLTIAIDESNTIYFASGSPRHLEIWSFQKFEPDHYLCLLNSDEAVFMICKNVDYNE